MPIKSESLQNITMAVSGEYSLLKKGIKQGLINKNAILETLISFKRAGANAIITYFADQISKELK